MYTRDMFVWKVFVAQEVPEASSRCFMKALSKRMFEIEGFRGEEGEDWN